MKLKKVIKYQCCAIVQPGEFGSVDRWDNQQCIETNARWLVKCEHCDKWFCLLFHWEKHVEKLYAEESKKASP